MSGSHISLSVSIQPESFYSMLSARSSPSVSHSQLPCNKASEGKHVYIYPQDAEGGLLLF